MSAKVHVSELIDRPVADVFHFHAREHVRNHPRWDPHMQLQQVTEGPIGVGTIINRVNSRSGKPVAGTMEIKEFEPDRAVTMLIIDGGIELIGRATYEAESPNRTKLTINVELPSMDQSMDTSMLATNIQASLQAIKQLLETEANG